MKRNLACILFNDWKLQRTSQRIVIQGISMCLFCCFVYISIHFKNDDQNCVSLAISCSIFLVAYFFFFPVINRLPVIAAVSISCVWFCVSGEKKALMYTLKCIYATRKWIRLIFFLAWNILSLFMVCLPQPRS